MKHFLKHNRSKEHSPSELTTRITNETVAEHREKILAGGRKFKYPVQYQKRKLVINSIIIGIAAVVFLTIAGWYQLYVAQNTSKLMYRITQIVPVNVASVDGEPVRYSDYLMRYMSTIFYMQKQNSINLLTNDGKRQALYYQRQELTNAERNAYVVKLAREQHLSISDKEVTNFIQSDVNARGVSLEAYEKTVLNSYYDWSLDDYKNVVKSELLKRKVAFVLDTAAKERVDAILKSVTSGADFTATATAQSDDTSTRANGGDSGTVATSNLDSDGLIAAAQKLQPNQISGIIQGVDAYYIIQLLSKDTNSVRYRVIEVKVTAFDQKFVTLQKDGKIQEYIKVKS